MRPVSLVVMEKGSQWPGHSGDAGDLVAVGAGPEALLERTRLRVDALGRAGRSVCVGVLACNGALDAPSIAGRTQVARELLRAVASGAPGRVVLTSPERSSPAVRKHLLDLVASLCEELAGTDVTLTVRFDRTAREPTTPAPMAHLRLVSARGPEPLAEFPEQLAI